MIYASGYTVNEIGEKKSYNQILDEKSEIVGHLLFEIRKGSGQIKFILDPEPQIGVVHLEIQADSGNYLMMIFEYDQYENELCRTYVDKNAPTGQVEILGNLWDRGLVCRSFNYLSEIVHSFVKNSNVSNDIII
jgi:hypothetical protein